MFNYNNLNDLEFEELVKDIMCKRYGKKFRTYTSGRDNGIDLYYWEERIVVQVKHYSKTGVNKLLSDLRNEIPKVKRFNPKDYFVVCSKELTHSNVETIFEMFFPYMKSYDNVITLKEINDFLEDEKNIDVLHKNTKLWLTSSKVLNLIQNQDVFMDSEVLQLDIEEDIKYFVETDIYRNCLSILEKENILMLIGAPGVGKTMTSKMLVAYYAAMGYKVKYSSDSDISAIKKSISQNSDEKEIIFLDDCFGQHYFNLKYDNAKQLIALIKYFKLRKNKKLILNSRITIFNEAKGLINDLKKIEESESIAIKLINLDEQNILDKGRILYNHLYFKNIDDPEFNIDYFKAVSNDRNYLKIVEHRNFNPRIIEYATMKHIFKKVESNEYFAYIMSLLNNPQDVWGNEFNNCIKAEDRLFLLTLYSFTNIHVDIELLKTYFNIRLNQGHCSNIDTTVNVFNAVLKRLLNSFVKIIDFSGEKMIGVMNPSVNDFLKNELNCNKVEQELQKKSIFSYQQMCRLYSTEELEKELLKKTIDQTILNLYFNDKYEKLRVLIYIITKYRIKNDIYIDVILDFLKNYPHTYNNTIKYIGRRVVDFNNPDTFIYAAKYNIFLVFDKEIFEFYNIKEIILDYNILRKWFENISLDEFNILSNKLYEFLLEYKDEIDMQEVASIISYTLEDAARDYQDNNIYISDKIEYYSSEILSEGYSAVENTSLINKINTSIADECYEEVLKTIEDIEWNFLKEKLMRAYEDISLDDYTDIIKSEISEYLDNQIEIDEENNNLDEIVQKRMLEKLFAY